jgi:hypothetical protein
VEQLTAAQVVVSTTGGVPKKRYGGREVAGTAVSNPAEGTNICLLCVLCVLCVVQVAGSATCRSLFQGSPTGCVYLAVCDLETATARRPWPELGCWVTEKSSVTRDIRLCIY